MKKLFPLTLIAASLMVAGCNSNSEDKKTVTPEPLIPAFDLTIGHINDTHSYFDAETLKFTNPSLSTDDAKFTVNVSAGGYARLANRLKEVRLAAKAQGENFLALHGGDAFQGTLYFNILKGAGNARLLPEMGLDAMVVGNHEFDLGNEALINFVKNVSFPVLAANIDTSNDPEMDALENLKPFIIKDFDGQKVGIFGLVLSSMETISSPGENLKFEDEVIGAQKTVDKLKEQGVDKVIMVSHIGVDMDKKVAENVNGIDIIIGGHSHTRLGDFGNLGLGAGHPEIDYAAIFTNPDGEGRTCVVQAGQYAEAVGKVKVSLTDDGKLVNCSGNNTLLIGTDYQHKYSTEKYADPEPLTIGDRLSTQFFVGAQHNIAVTEEDATVKAIIDTDYAPMVEVFKQTIIGDVADANDPTDTSQLDHVRIPGKARKGASLPVTGTEVGVHVSDAYAWKLKQQNYDIDFTITNTGGIRSDLKSNADGINAGQAVSLLSFGNDVAVTKLKGADVRKVLQESILDSMHPDSSSDGSFPTFNNLKVTFLGDQTEGSFGGTITELQVCPEGYSQTATCTDIEDEMVYSIATNAYIGGGKGGYPTFASARIGEMITSGFKDNEVFIEYAQFLTAQGKKFEEKPTGLNFTVPAGYASKLDNPAKKPEDNQ